MSLSEIVSYDKEGNIGSFSLFRKLFLSLVIILVSLLSFGIGRLSVVSNREAIKIEYDPALVGDPPTNSSTSQVDNKAQTASVINAVEKQAPERSSEVVVSKNGSKYHYLHCSGAKQIKEDNKILFPTAKAAETAGYTLAANCKTK